MAPRSIVKAKKATVLVVDDDPAMTDLLRYMLAELGYDTIIALNGRKALQEAAARLPDCILLDLNMPDLDGYGFLSAQTKSAQLCRIPTIVLSSRNRSDEVQRAIKLGACGYITKPISLTVLARRMEKVLAKADNVKVRSSVSWLD